MTIESANIAQLARLARLALSQEEMTRFSKDMTRILDMVAQLKEIDVSDIKPMCHAGDRQLTLREDVAYETLGRESLKESQGYEEGLIRVPKIIE